MKVKNKKLVMLVFLAAWAVLFFLCYLSGYAMHEISHVF